MKASLRSGSLRWPVLAALLLISLAAPARDGGGGGGHGGSHAGSGHRGGGHGDRHGGVGHGGRSHRAGHVFFGLGYWPSWYADTYAYGYGYPLYAAPLYVEQGDESPSGYAYYCADSRGYYPAVTQCPSGWLRVIPAPVAQ